jgi:hypothetical protein
MSLKFTKGTDTEHEIKLDSVLISAEWRAGVADGGQSVEFEVRTSMVGEGAPVKIKGKSAKGKKLGKVDGTMRGNTFVGSFDIPEDIELGDEVFLEVKLPKNSLNGESGRIPARPPIEVTNMKWSAQEARRGEVLTLTADVKGVPPETEATVTIYEHDQDGAHDKITELPAVVVGEKIETDWEYEYHEDTDDIPTEEEMQRYGRSYNPPEYFFTIKFERAEFGKAQESGLLKFKDWVEISLADDTGALVPNEKYTLNLPDGTKREGSLDSNGQAREDGVPPGAVSVEFPKYSYVTVSEAQSD